ncbi:MAG: hypothetical protein JW937_01610 [Candidatus Omnitrophica bacterium]|nr:hypothetical protein [Candidatus Omnitrophota bacterium]
MSQAAPVLLIIGFAVLVWITIKGLGRSTLGPLMKLGLALIAALVFLGLCLFSCASQY